MNFKPLALLVVATLATAALSQAQSPCSPAQFPLMNADGDVLGSVQVMRHGNRVCVTYKVAKGDLLIADASLAVAETASGIPGMERGAPDAFGFSWMTGHAVPMNAEHTLPMGAMTGCVLMPEDNRSGQVVVSTQVNLSMRGVSVEAWAGFGDGTNSGYVETTCLAADES